MHSLISVNSQQRAQVDRGTFMNFEWAAMMMNTNCVYSNQQLNNIHVFDSV